MKILRKPLWHLANLTDFNRLYEKWVYHNCRLNKRGRIGREISLIVNIILRILFNCDIAPSVTLGKNVKIPHSVGIVIGATASIGDGTVIMPNVVIGSKHYPPQRGEKRHATIGKDCLLGANAVILGDIVIGDHCIIGAGAFVDRDVPARSMVVGRKEKVEG